MCAVIAGLSPDGYQPHTLHAQTRDWPETNCFVDLWIEVLGARGLDPTPALGVCAAMDFEGDQFTFFKLPFADLDALYGIRVLELSIFDSVEAHACEQLRRGHMPMVEVDAFHLPDTRGVSYGLEHSKTTIGINALDAQARRLGYFHNAGYFTLEGEDYEGIFRPKGALLFPYAEFAKFDGVALQGEALVAAARTLLASHVAAMPLENPFAAFAARVDAQAADVGARDPAYFHKYAFNTLRQAGSNFELLASHVAWLTERGAWAPGDLADRCQTLSAQMKSFQFQLARAIARRRSGGLAEILAPSIALWNDIALALRTGCA